MPARDAETARRAVSDIARVEVLAMDLLDPAAISSFADQFLAAHASLDLLILRAGVMATPLFRDADGHEGQFVTNYLGHFRLTAALWPALRAARGARVVMLSSRGHQFGSLDLGDLDFTRRPYDKWLAYGQAKTAVALFAAALDARGRKHGVRAFSVHPGSILGPLARYLSREEDRHVQRPGRGQQARDRPLTGHEDAAAGRSDHGLVRHRKIVMCDTGMTHGEDDGSNELALHL